MNEKKKEYFTQRMRDENSFRSIIKKISLSEKDLTTLENRAKRSGLKLATFIYKVLMGLPVKEFDASHNEINFRIQTIAVNFGQICKHPNVGDFFHRKHIDMMISLKNSLAQIAHFDSVLGVKENSSPSGFDDDDVSIRKKISEVKKRDPNNKRLIRQRVAISPRDKEILDKYAKYYGVKTAEYMYWRIMNKPLKYISHLDSDSLWDIARFSDRINNISHNYNYSLKLSGEDVRTIIDIIHNLQQNNLLKI